MTHVLFQSLRLQKFPLILIHPPYIYNGTISLYKYFTGLLIILLLDPLCLQVCPDIHHCLRSYEVTETTFLTIKYRLAKPQNEHLVPHLTFLLIQSYRSDPHVINCWGFPAHMIKLLSPELSVVELV